MLPNRQNRTIQLEGYQQRSLVSAFNSAYLKFYGLGILIAHMEVANRFYRYYTKLDSIIGIIGGGVFILFAIYACVGYRINRQRYR